MAQLTMYPAKDGSPQTTITATLSDSSTEVTVAELACFPAVGTEGANLLTLWNDTSYETCEYIAKSTSSGAGTLTIVRTGTRHASSTGGGIEWAVGTKIARNPTGYDHNAFKANVEDLDSRLDTVEGEIDALQAAPPAHKTIHQSGGTDAIKLDDLAAADDNTDLNVSTSAHGLCPKLPNDATKYLDGSGNYTIPEGNAIRDNLLINGGFDVWQRGTTFDASTWRANNDDSYLEDRWLLLSDGNDIVDVSRASSTFGTSQYCSKMVVQTANKQFARVNIMPASDVIPLRGKSVSFSFKAKTTEGHALSNLRAGIIEWTGAADTVTSDAVGTWAGAGTNPTLATNWAFLNTPANLALSTTETTYEIENVTVGASANNLAVIIWLDDTDASVADELYLAEVKLEIGTNATEYQYRDDFATCALFGITLASIPAIANGRHAPIGVCDAAGSIHYIQMTPPMRAVPTLFKFGVFEIACGNGNFTASNIILSGSSTRSMLVISVTAAGVTVGDRAELRNKADTTAVLFLEAEL